MRKKKSILYVVCYAVSLFPHLNDRRFVSHSCKSGVKFIALDIYIFQGKDRQSFRLCGRIWRTCYLLRALMPTVSEAELTPRAQAQGKVRGKLKTCSLCLPGKRKQCQTFSIISPVINIFLLITLSIAWNDICSILSFLLLLLFV